MTTSIRHYLLFSVFCVIISLAVLSAGCGSKPQQAQQEQSIPVKTDTIVLKDIQETIDYVGDIRALDEVWVYPKVSGKIIEKRKNEGAAVSKGEVVAYIDRDEVGEKYEPAPVESPISGTVGRIHVDIGTQVTPQTAIALIVNMSSMTIDLNIPEKYLGSIHLGHKASLSVDAYPDSAFSGEISKISPVVNPALRAAPVEITVSNPDAQLQSGMFARVRIVMREFSGVPVIMKEALLGSAPDNYVYVVDAGKARKRPVKTGVRQAGYVAVSEGLRQGDKVVVLGQQQLYDGVAVVEQNEARVQ